MCFFAAPLAVGAAGAAAGSIGGGIATTAALNAALATGTGLGTIGASVLAPAAFAIPTWVSPALTLLSGGIQANSAIQQGNALKAAGAADQIAANNQALIMEQNAGQERAKGQRAASEQRRMVNLARSRAQTLTAASGTVGTGVIDILSDLDAEGEFRYQTAMAGGESAAQGLEYGAAVRRGGGQAAADAGEAQRRALQTRAATTLAGSAANATLLAKYG